MDIRYHDSVNVLQEMFAARADRADTLTPFDRPEWFALLEETGLSPLLVTAQDAGKSAALVLQRSGKTLTPLANWYNFIWRPAMLLKADRHRLLSAMATDLRKKTHRVALTQVPEEDGSATAIAAAFDSAGWRVEVSQCDTNHVLHVQGRSFAEYWSQRPGPLRTTLKRKRSKVECTLFDRFNDQAWTDYESIYQHSWKPTEGEPAMLRAFAKAEGDAGRLRFGIAAHDGKPVAAQFWTVENDTAFIHKLAHLESHKRLSAGTTLTAALFERVIDVDKVSLVDFGTGDEHYKTDWMETVRPRYRIDCIDLKQMRGWLDLTRLALGRTRVAEIPALAPRPTQS